MKSKFNKPWRTSDGSASFPYASSKLSEIYGVTPEQVKDDATAVFATIYPEDLPALAASIQQSAQQLSLWQQEYRLMQADGSLRWVSGRAMPERMPDNSILWHGYIYDITTTKEYYLALERANDDLKLAQQRLELSSQQAQIGYWQVSLRSGALWWSPMIYDLFGLDEQTTNPDSELFKRIVQPDDLDLVERSEAQAIETGYHDVIHRIIRADGEVRWVHELA
ncbi:PAS domain-containing protein [Aliidiomarina maris]|uniref:histidine kinase n=1 Tax=Aliidiomarina maris TaxID=531312 RepID=A0A327X686_9GAMM|nr:PAS domain-containing protein [Aliidiomarina maris]RAK01403.1 PAS domain S-box-containing protein [Aliidiomarina maris]